MNDSDSDSEDEEANSGNNLLNRIIEWYYKSNNKKKFLGGISTTFRQSLSYLA